MNSKNVLRKIGECFLVTSILVGFAIIMGPLNNGHWDVLPKEYVDPYEGIVCMHGTDIRAADYDSGHICEHMDVLRSEETYMRTFAFVETGKVEITEDELVLIKNFIGNLENTDKDMYVFELTENGIDDWIEFEQAARAYCADYYTTNEEVTGCFADTWCTDADGRVYVELDVAHCREVISKCEQEVQRRIIIEAAIKEDVTHMDLNGYKVHDLKAIHDYICNNAMYDWDLQNSTIYDFFVVGTVHCAGYARTFKAICDYVGLEVDIVVGTVGGEGHAWNSVVIDGQKYYIDCTWDDTEDGQVSYEHFLTNEPSGIAASDLVAAKSTEQPTTPSESLSNQEDINTPTEEMVQEAVTEPPEPTEIHEEYEEGKYTPEQEEATEPITEPSEPVINCVDTDEYLYVSSSKLNIRTGPSTDYEIITSVYLNTLLHRTGKCDNGWSRIDYDGQTAYVYSNYLSYEETHIETVLEEMARRGNIGRLTIPSVGVNVALFETSVYNINHSQVIVDAADSAAYLSDTMTHYGFVMIGDHVHQGFSAIKNTSIGTVAYIDRGEYRESYVCTEKFIGYNGYGGRTGMFDTNGNDVAGRNPGGLCMYTCNSDGTITITFWQPQ